MEHPKPGAGIPELAEYADGFVAWLGGLGYSPRTCEAQVALLRHLAGWLAQQGVPLSGLSSEVAGEYDAVRALLRFAWLEGLTAVPLAGFVGSFAAPAGPAVPEGLSPAQAAEFLAFVRAAPGGLRNEPMMALLLRLALRAGEAAGLLLDDIAWRQGVITVRGKGNRAGQVPLPADVGGPLARYLRDARPGGTAHRQVFLALDAPHAPLAQSAVTSVAGRALRDAGISGEGAAHLLRHTAACGVLAAGGGLAGAGQLLRHAGPQVTAVYARSDLAALRTVARPWPEEGGPR